MKEKEQKFFYLFPGNLHVLCVMSSQLEKKKNKFLDVLKLLKKLHWFVTHLHVTASETHEQTDISINRKQTTV